MSPGKNKLRIETAASAKRFHFSAMTAAARGTLAGRFCFLLVCGLSVAPASAAPAASPEESSAAASGISLSEPGAHDADGGRVLFDAFGCRSCHRLRDIGGNSGPDLSLVGFRRSRRWLLTWLKDPKAWKKNSLMPDYRISSKALNALAAFLSEQRGRAFSAALPWDKPTVGGSPTKRGRVIYLRAGCVACHGPKGQGGQPNNNVPGGLIPALDRALETFSAEELKMKIRKGVLTPQRADPAGPAPMTFMPRWGDILKDDEIDSVVAYLFSLGSGKNKNGEW